MEELFAASPKRRYYFLPVYSLPSRGFRRDSWRGALPLFSAAPLWQQLWFQVILGAAVVALIVVAFRLRLGGIREQNARLELQVRQRTAELENANARLEKEVEQRKRAEAELKKRRLGRAEAVGGPLPGGV